MPKVTFKQSGKSVEAEDGEWLYEVCDRSDSGVPFGCKAGACGTCATEVLKGGDNLDKQTAREVRTLEAHGLDPKTHRLPCLSEVHGDVVFGKPANAIESKAKPQSHEVLVESHRPLNLTVCEVRFFVPQVDFSFRPGQYMIFNIPQEERTLRRSYSISTPPSDKRHFEICVRSVAGGRGSNYVHSLRPGTQLKVDGPFGKFVLNEDSEKDIVMIATGTGMSPIKSMLMHLLDSRSGRRVRLFFGLRHESDLFYTDLLRGLKALYPALEYHIALTAPTAGGWSGPQGRVTTLLEDMLTEADAANSEAYLCGGRAMIKSSKEVLAAKGFPKDAVHHENFY